MQVEEEANTAAKAKEKIKLNKRLPMGQRVLLALAHGLCVFLALAHGAMKGGNCQSILLQGEHLIKTAARGAGSVSCWERELTVMFTRILMGQLGVEKLLENAVVE